ncbi:hypothetical protein JHK87_042144 [Glycine soja]|nr:hypothetical protein JHK87_042144 [Glycine soja]
MEEVLSLEVDSNTQQQKITADVLPFAGSYQLEALDNAIRENTIVYLETGSGKTLIAVMLLRSYAHHLRKPSPQISVFLVPQVVLVSQQAEAVKKHTDLKVGMFWGDMGVDFWDATTWKQEVEKHEVRAFAFSIWTERCPVFVMTPAILLNCLRHSFLKLNLIKVLIMDECHHARGKHPYACIMTVLGDIIESLAGAILVDSRFNKEVVWQSIRPLLEPLVTPETLKLHPIRELNELCQKRSYKIVLEDVSRKDGVTNYRMELEADGVIHEYEYTGPALRDTAKKIACKEILNSLKEEEL